MSVTFDEIMAFHPDNSEVFKEIKMNLRQLMPFVGAGMTASIYLGWNDAIRALGNKIGNEADRDILKSKIENEGSLAAADFLEEKRGKTNLIRSMVNYFSIEKYKNAPMEKRNGLATQLLPFLFPCPVLTTNFDEVLELTYRENNYLTFPVLNPSSPSLREQAVRLMNSPCLFKLHGSISGDMTDYDTIVFTTAQYDVHYGKDSPTREALKEFLQRRSLLFLGCSLEKDRTVDVMRECARPGAIHFAILNCSEATRDQRIRELDGLNIRALVYPEGEYDSVRIILERLLEETDPDAYQRLPLHVSALPTVDKTKIFHFQERMSGFTGRDEELKELISFVTKDKIDFRWWALTGPGGSGKSRLSQELAIEIQQRFGWDCHRLTQEDYRTLPDSLKNWTRPTLLIADYVQGHARALGEAMEDLLDSPRSSQLRLLLVERSGKSSNYASIELNWVEQLYENVHNRIGLKNSCWKENFMQLDPLNDEELLKVMRSFAENLKRAGLSDREIPNDIDLKRLLGILYDIDPKLRRPLYGLILTFAMMDGREPTEFGREQVLDYIVDREGILLEERIREVTAENRTNCKLYKACLDIRNLATALLGTVRTSELKIISPHYYRILSEAAEKYNYEDEVSLLKRLGLMEGDSLRPLEPDLIGEYCVLRKLLYEADDKQRTDYILWIWNDPIYAPLFFNRMFNDYSKLLNESKENWRRLILPPEILQCKWSETYDAHSYGVLLSNTVGVCNEETRHIISEYFEKLHNICPDEKDVTKICAVGLFNIIYFQDASEAEKTINQFELLCESSQYKEEIVGLFAKALFNYSDVQDITGRERTVDRIEALHKKYPTNEEIAISFSCALANLSAKQNAIGATQTLEKIEALHTLFLKNKEITHSLAKVLSNLCRKQSLSGKRKTQGRIESLFQDAPNDAIIATELAAALHSISCQEVLADESLTVGIIDSLFREFSPNARLAAITAKGYLNLCLEQDVSATENSVNRIKEIYESDTSNEKVAVDYAKELEVLIKKQDVLSVVPTLDKFNKLFNSNSSNIEIANAYTRSIRTIKEKIEHMGIKH